MANNNGTALAIGTDMMAVATRIQERARILMEERSKVKSTEPILLELRMAREKEQAINDRRRKHLLESINERNGVELGIFDLRDAIQDLNENIRVAQQKRIESTERIRVRMEERIQDATAFYGPNLAQMECYAKVLETVVESKERAVERRRKRLQKLRDELANSKTNEERIRRETETTIREANMLREQGGNTGSSSRSNGNGNINRSNSNSNGNKKALGRQEDEEITVLSKRVRETIDQVRACIYLCVCVCVCVCVCGILYFVWCHML